MGGMRGVPQRFEEQYHCMSFAMSGKQLIEESDKILLPASALETLARLNVEYPMLFEISADGAVGGLKTHCGVLEFSADEGRCYLPYWMMQNLNLDEGTIINVKNVSLPKATYTKIRAQSVDFLEITNHRAVLEVTLRNFSCLTKGEIIAIKHDDKLHHLEVCDVQPNGAASIIETDMQVDFEEPVGYQQSKYAAQERAAAEARQAAIAEKMAARPLQKARIDGEDADGNGNETAVFQPFVGKAKRLDGKELKKKKDDSSSGSTSGSSSSASANGNGNTLAAPSVSPGTTSASSASPAPQRKSLVGNKFAKKTNTTSAFTGSGKKLG